MNEVEFARQLKQVLSNTPAARIAHVSATIQEALEIYVKESIEEPYQEFKLKHLVREVLGASVSSSYLATTPRTTSVWQG